VANNLLWYSLAAPAALRLRHTPDGWSSEKFLKTQARKVVDPRFSTP